MNKSKPEESKQENITINGTVSYRERITPPPESKLYVRLNNISQADASSINIEEQSFDLSKHPIPVKYQFNLTKDQLKPKETYAIRAEIRGADDKLLWTTDTTHPVDTTKASQTLDEIIMVSVKPVSANDSIMGLINTNWEVSSINGAGIIDKSRADVTFSMDGKISGLAGCNRYMGDYKIHNNTLNIEPLAVTQRACQPPLNKQEFAFLNIIRAVNHFSFNAQGDLILKTAEGKTITAQHP